MILVFKKSQTSMKLSGIMLPSKKQRNIRVIWYRLLVLLEEKFFILLCDCQSETCLRTDGTVDSCHVLLLSQLWHQAVATGLIINLSTV